MHPRRIRPPVRQRLRRRVVSGLPRTARALHLLRTALRRDRRHPVDDRPPPDHPVVSAVGSPYCLQVLHLGRADDRCAEALEAAGAGVTTITTEDLDAVVPDSFDLAVALGESAPVDALLDLVQLVVTDAAPIGHHDADTTEHGLQRICRRVDPIVDGTRYRAIHSRVHSSALAPLSRRRRYTHAVDPATGQEFFVKWIGTTGVFRRQERRMFLAELAAHRAITEHGGAGPHLPRLITAEIAPRHGAIVTPLLPGHALDDANLVLDLPGSRQVLHQIGTALAALLECSGLHHNDVRPHNIRVGEPTVLFDLDRAGRRREEPFAVELARLTAAIRARLPAHDHAAWDAFVDALPTAGPHALLEHLGGAVSPPARSAAVLR